MAKKSTFELMEELQSILKNGEQSLFLCLRAIGATHTATTSTISNCQIAEKIIHATIKHWPPIEKNDNELEEIKKMNENLQTLKDAMKFLKESLEKIPGFEKLREREVAKNGKGD